MPRCRQRQGYHLALLQLIPSSAATGSAMSKTAPTGTYPYAKFGDSKKLEEGDLVMARGPMGAVAVGFSLGIISAQSGTAQYE